MKKFLTAIFIAFIAQSAFAETNIVIPVDFITKVVKKVEVKTDVNVVQRFLINQLIKNASIDGVKIKDYTVENLIAYFNNDKIFKQISENKLMEPNTGATLEFDSDGKCEGANCTIKLDLNGDLGPNEIWQEASIPKDQIIVTLKKDDNGGVELIFPEYSK